MTHCTPSRTAVMPTESNLYYAVMLPLVYIVLIAALSVFPAMLYFSIKQLIANPSISGLAATLIVVAFNMLEVTAIGIHVWPENGLKIDWISTMRKVTGTVAIIAIIGVFVVIAAIGLHLGSVLSTIERVAVGGVIFGLAVAVLIAFIARMADVRREEQPDTNTVIRPPSHSPITFKVVEPTQISDSNGYPQLSTQRVDTEEESIAVEWFTVEENHDEQ